MSVADQIIENRKNELCSLRLHDSLQLNKWVSVLRVVGGWIYQFNCPPDEGTDYGVFVPLKGIDQ